MCIQIASDLHLEFHDNRIYLKKNPLRPIGKILVLAGDVMPVHAIGKGYYMDFFTFCSDHFERTYWIAGNHEFYHADIGIYKGHFVEDIKANVHFVNNHVARHYDSKLIMSTLWTSISEKKLHRIENGMNDYRFIRNGGNPLRARDTNRLFEENRQFLAGRLAEDKAKTRIVITHHVPTFDNYPQEFAGSILDEAFSVDMNSLIERSGIDYWVFGHHHRNVPEFLIGKTRMVTNQLGYTWHGEHTGYNPGFLIGS